MTKFLDKKINTLLEDEELSTVLSILDPLDSGVTLKESLTYLKLKENHLKDNFFDTAGKLYIVRQILESTKRNGEAIVEKIK